MRHGVDAYVIDNESEDNTVPLVREFLGRGVIGLETFPRNGIYPWQMILGRKEQLASSLEADWFIHTDPDELPLPGAGAGTLAQAFAEVERQGFNAVNFLEFTFVPTRQSPDHEHANFAQTMRWYYPYLPTFPHRLKAWKKQQAPVEFAWSGGHIVRFPNLKMYPQSFPMRHYLFLSAAHAARKWVGRPYDPEELSRGWHRARARLSEDQITLQDERELRVYESDARLDASNPLTRHPIFSV